MARPHLVAGLVFLLLAAFLGREAGRLSYYSSLGPGAGFFPVWLCVVLALLALSVTVNALRGRIAGVDGRFWPENGALLRIAAVLGGLAFVVATLNILGFRIAMAIFCVWSMLALGCRSPLQIGAVALLGSIGCKALFVEVLGVALPSGILGW
jgi:putative tricarboxylic transport membrane protein